MRHGLVEFGFKVHRRLEAERAVEPRPVVKDFDPLEEAALASARVAKVRGWIKPRLRVLQKLSIIALS